LLVTHEGKNIEPGIFFGVSNVLVCNSLNYYLLGVSNVGKSSLLNALTRQWGIVRTSDKPGLTQVWWYENEDQISKKDVAIFFKFLIGF
jgi:GTP-binding protein EngB required for normal cell division